MKPPSLLFLLNGLGMMLVAVAAVMLGGCGKRPLWRVLGIGAGAWAIGVALKFAWAIPMNAAIRRGLQLLLGAAASAPFYWLYVGLLTGIFECGIALLFVRRSQLRNAGWHQAVAFGVGFGAMEAFALGAVATLTLVLSTIFFDVLPPSAKTPLLKSYGSFALIPLSVFERITALLAHVFSCVLIVMSVRLARQRWFWLSFAYKTALDGVAAWSILAYGVRESVGRLAQTEVLFAAFAVVAAAGLARLKPRFPRFGS
jgi:uncharacterized membrane protein YhfC